MIEADAKMLGISPDDAKAQIVAQHKELEKLGLNPNITKGSLSEHCRITGYEPSLVLLIEGDIGKISQKQDNLADDKTSTRREYNQVKFEEKNQAFSYQSPHVRKQAICTYSRKVSKSRHIQRSSSCI